MYKRPDVNTNVFHIYSNASFANKANFHSQSGNAIILNSGTILWYSKRQGSIATSTMHAEYATMAEATKQVLWLHKLFKELGYDQTKPTVMFGDNQAALQLTVNPMFHKRSWHFPISLEVTWEAIKWHQVVTEFQNTKMMVTDILTKALPKPSHQEHTHSLGLHLAWGGV